MSFLRVNPTKSFNIEVLNIAPDKSISHRCAIFSLLSDKKSHIKNYLMAEDTLNTLNIVEQLGAKINYFEDGSFEIIPPKEINEPNCILECGNSGTTIRILMGFLSGKDGFFVLHGDKYLTTRPMRRVADPLRNIGAKIDGRKNGDLAPISIRGAKLKAFNYESKIASAQVKTALILAALRADGTSTFSEPELSRDHTEKMLKKMGANISNFENKITIFSQNEPLEPLNITVPCDPSSAFFFAVAAAIVPNSKIVLKNMLLNKTRIEAYKVLASMGAKIEFLEKENIYDSVGDIVVSHFDLKAVEVSENISWLIDEIPALSIAFACAKGTSNIKNAQELRVKESDRIAAVVNNLKLCGINSNETQDGFSVEGGDFKDAILDSYGDHRIAMSFAIAGLISGTKVTNVDCINASFPEFVNILREITKVDKCR